MKFDLSDDVVLQYCTVGEKRKYRRAKVSGAQLEGALPVLDDFLPLESQNSASSIIMIATPS